MDSGGGPVVANRTGNTNAQPLTALNRKSTSVVNGYWYVPGTNESVETRVSVWDMLLASKYPGADQQTYSLKSEIDWVLLHRSTRRRMKDHVSRYLAALKACNSACVDDSSVHVEPSDSAGVSHVEQGCLSASNLANDLAQETSESPVERSTSSPSSTFDSAAPLLEEANVPAGPFSSTEQDSPRAAGTSTGAVIPDFIFHYETSGHYVSLNQDLIGEDNVLQGLGATRRLKMSELLRSMVAKYNIPHVAVDEFVRDCRRENPENDLSQVPVTFRHRDRLDNEDLASLAKAIVDVEDGQAEFVHIGLHRQLKKHLERVLDATFPAGGARPAVPCLAIDAWTDGTELKKTGPKTQCWPVAVRFIAVGVWHDDPAFQKFVPVPDEVAFKPLTTSVYLGSHKPKNGETLLRDLVNELKWLDPRHRPERSDVSAEGLLWKQRRSADFTVTLRWFIADTLARHVVKNVGSFSRGGDGGCEWCLSVGTKHHRKQSTCRPDIKETPALLRRDDLYLDYKSHLNVSMTGFFSIYLFFMNRAKKFNIPHSCRSGLHRFESIFVSCCLCLCPVKINKKDISDEVITAVHFVFFVFD
jgi:hypothetical protein